LLGHVAEGDLDVDMLGVIDAVARKRPSEHSPGEAAIDAALDDFFAERISLSALVSACWRAQHRGPAAGATPASDRPARPQSAWHPPQSRDPPASGPATAVPTAEDRPPWGLLPAFLARPIWCRFLTPVLIFNVTLFAGPFGGYSSAWLAAGLVLSSLNVWAFQLTLGVFGWLFNSWSLLVLGLVLLGSFLQIPVEIPPEAP
jgi:hypothetical protein